MLGCAQNSYLIFFFSLLLLSVAAPLKPVDVDIRNLNSRVLYSQGPKKVFWHAKKPQKVKNAIHMFFKIVLPGLDKSESVSSIRIKPSDWEGVPDPRRSTISL
ncbi:hypothetical protein C8R41DRAFT_14590 [Lentinula lateritia]|uniref:Uncharacterized protein n=1 Tax=Lentinula lateritia TaxID=40482 RepID=A0ABQ8W1R7_9AGAR|nr:hypothetical protein C8R41DRAFT_14590 [Lentinula lateritia]